MQINVDILLVLISFVLHGLEAGRNSRESKWIETLKICVSENFAQYQVAMIIEEKSDEYAWIVEITNQISQKFPSVTVNYEKIIAIQRDKITIKLPGVNPEASTLFISVLTKNDASFVIRALDVVVDIIYLTTPKPRPKILFLHLNNVQNSSYESIFKSLYKSKLLDVTFIQIKRSSKTVKDQLLNRQKENAILHMYNPFNKTYIKQKLTPKSILFPDKVRNMYNCKFQSSTWNSITFIETKFIEALSEAMNFTSVIIPIKEINGLIEPFHDRDNQMFLSIVNMYNIIQHYELYRFTSFVEMTTVHAVIPVFQRHNFVIEVSWEFVGTIFGTVFGIFFIRFLAKVLKFEAKYWRLMYIVQMILGSSVPNEPQRAVQRMVFGTILLTWIIYSGYIHSVLTNVALHEEPGINTLDDLIESNLSIMMKSFERSWAKVGSDTYSKKLSNKSILIWENMTNMECAEYLLKHKNVSCLMTKIHFGSISRQYEGMKIINQPFQYRWKTFRLPKASPYRNRINQLITIFLETGLFNNWKIFNDEVEIKIEDGIESHQIVELRKILFSILLIGFLLSLTAFTIEIIVGQFMKKT